MRRIIHIYAHLFPRVSKEMDLLASRYEVDHHHIDWRRGLLLNFVHQFFFIWRNRKNCDLFWIHHGGYWALLPTVFGRIRRIPVCIVLGGADSVSLESIAYGSFRKSLLSLVLHWIYRRADVLVPVDESLVSSVNSFQHNYPASRQGIKFFVSRLETKIEVIHNGFDGDRWFSLGLERRPRSFITVASVRNQSRFLMKGIDIILRLAEVLPNCHFSIVGIDPSFRDQLPASSENVEYLDYLSQPEIFQLLNQTQYYLQPSRTEGFPSALAEAMLCECVPIVSTVNSMPNIVGSSGYLLASSHVPTVAQIMEDVIALSDLGRAKLGQLARQRIVENFSILQRKRKIEHLVEDLLSSN